MMREDFSRIIYDRYSRHPDTILKVILLDGRIVEGRIIGYFRGMPGRGEAYIFRWHILPSHLKIADYDRTVNPDAGTFIEHKDIRSYSFN